MILTCSVFVKLGSLKFSLSAQSCLISEPQLFLFYQSAQCKQREWLQDIWENVYIFVKEVDLQYSVSSCQIQIPVICTRMKICFAWLLLSCKIISSVNWKWHFLPCAPWKMTWMEPMSYQLSTTRGQYPSSHDGVKSSRETVWHRHWKISFQWNRRLRQLLWHGFQVEWPSLPAPTARKHTADMYN